MEMRMGAESRWTVRVLRLVEALVEVDAITGSGAEEEASKLPGVAVVIGVVRK
jgi:hypothetical protein